VADFPELELWSAETADLDRVLAALAPADWEVITPFKSWPVREHVRHLNVSDVLAAASAADPQDFRLRRRELAAALAPGPTDPPAAEVLQSWRDGVGALARGLRAVEAGARLPWFGPDMSARAFITARQMETWAHGQTIHDALGLRRAATDRIRTICELGWRTLGWSFQVHGRERPTVPLYLKLTAPFGAVWTWGEPAAADRVEGPAEDFALVVCQCRNIADTGLQVDGAVAALWMSDAQCFAGAPSDPPPPGVRTTPQERRP
jgi:uncharacterized protein (TIGR03084 family)